MILVYDVSNRDSFLGMEHWFGEVEQYAQAGVVKCLVGAKIDKVSRRAEGEVEGEDDGEGEIGRAVRTAEGRALAERYGALFVEVSSKTRENVRRPFVDVVDKIVESPELLKGGDAGKRRSEGGGVNVTAGQEGDGWGCAC